MEHQTKIITARRLYATRYDAECSCGFTVGSFLRRTQAAAAAEEHLERREALGDAVAWVAP